MIRMRSSGLVCAALAAVSLFGSSAGCVQQLCPDPGEASLAEFLAARVECARMPAIAAAIVRDDGIAFAEGFGLADIEQQQPATADTLFMLASVSKLFTWTALLQLHEQGLFALDDEVDAFLPFAVRNPNHPGTAVTFRMLLTHTSSIRDNYSVIAPLYVAGDSPIPLARLLSGYFATDGEYYDAQRNWTDQPPGAAFRYSNIGATLAGYLVERISGGPFDEYCRRAIFEPLGMNETAWRLAGLDVQHIAVPYQDGGWRFVPQAHYGYPDYPDGSLRTSARQLARYLQMMLNGGELDGARILQPETIEQMWTAQASLDGRDADAGSSASTSRIGLGWFIDEIDGRVIVSHTGGDKGVSTSVALSPSEGIATVVLTNVSTGFLRAGRLGRNLEEIQQRLFDEARGTR